MTMADRVNVNLARPRLYAVLLGGLAGFALLIAGIGLFGVLSYTVSQRAREIGVRTALGATPFHVLRLIGVPSAGVIAAGAAAGLIAAYGTARARRHIFIRREDPRSVQLRDRAAGAVRRGLCRLHRSRKTSCEDRSSDGASTRALRFTHTTRDQLRASTPTDARAQCPRRSMPAAPGSRIHVGLSRLDNVGDHASDFLGALRFWKTARVGAPVHGVQPEIGPHHAGRDQ